MEIGDLVRVIDDEYEELVGLTGVLKDFGPDGTTAIVEVGIRAWFSVCNLEKVE